ncbi:hypothetical protein GCM10010498_27140 [Streptomyces cavourensis]|nr:hypothetical protein GCM10010498_27140 [Streptomyces cavourensis]
MTVTVGMLWGSMGFLGWVGGWPRPSGARGGVPPPARPAFEDGSVEVGWGAPAGGADGGAGSSPARVPSSSAGRAGVVRVRWGWAPGPGKVRVHPRDGSVLKRRTGLKCRAGSVGRACRTG